MAFEEIKVKKDPVEFVIKYGDKEYKFKKREVTWYEMNRVLSKSVEVNKKGATINRHLYNEEMAALMLVETPWPIEETRLMLRQLGADFGGLLEAHIPQPKTQDEFDFFEEK